MYSNPFLNKNAWFISQNSAEATIVEEKIFPIHDCDTPFKFNEWITNNKNILKTRWYHQYFFNNQYKKYLKEWEPAGRAKRRFSMGVSNWRKIASSMEN